MPLCVRVLNSGFEKRGSEKLRRNRKKWGRAIINTGEHESCIISTSLKTIPRSTCMSDWLTGELVVKAPQTFPCHLSTHGLSYHCVKEIVVFRVVNLSLGVVIPLIRRFSFFTSHTWRSAYSICDQTKACKEESLAIENVQVRHRHHASAVAICGGRTSWQRWCHHLGASDRFNCVQARANENWKFVCSVLSWEI